MRLFFGRLSAKDGLVNPAIGRGGVCVFGLYGRLRREMKCGGVSFRRFKHGGIALGVLSS